MISVEKTYPGKSTMDTDSCCTAMEYLFLFPDTPSWSKEHRYSDPVVQSAAALKVKNRHVAKQMEPFQVLL